MLQTFEQQGKIHTNTINRDVREREITARKKQLGDSLFYIYK